MSHHGRWVFVTEEKGLPENGMRLFFPAGLATLMMRRGGEIIALSNRCPHLGCALAGGTLEGDILRCPCHDWTFDIRTGKMTQSAEIRLPVYETKVEDGKISMFVED